jgi:hypothetical protein
MTINDQITDAVTQMVKHVAGIADNLSTLLTVLEAFKADKPEEVVALDNQKTTE